MGDKNYWKHYSPSVPLAIAATVIFTLLTAVHIFRLFRSRTWFCIPLVIGGICACLLAPVANTYPSNNHCHYAVEVFGYAFRVIGHHNQTSLAPYVAQALLILLAPILFAATVYMVLGRIIRATGAASYSIIRVNWVTKVFVSGDIICFLIQAVGAAMLSSANTASEKTRGQNIILVGLIVQILVFAFFVIVAWIFHRRLNLRPTGKWAYYSLTGDTFMRMLYVVSGLITVRNLFRVVEYGMGG